MTLSPGDSFIPIKYLNHLDVCGQILTQLMVLVGAPNKEPQWRGDDMYLCGEKVEQVKTSSKKLQLHCLNLKLVSFVRFDLGLDTKLLIFEPSHGHSYRNITSFPKLYLNLTRSLKGQFTQN